MAPPRTLPSNRASAHDATPTLLARYDDLERLRHAIANLEAHGVDGDDLALVGEGALEVEAESGHGATDGRLIRYTSRRIVASVLLGALAGAVLGAVTVGATLLIWSDLTARGWVFALMVAWFASCGGLVGAFIAFFRTLGFSDAMPLTYAPEPEHQLWLAVYGTADDVEATVAATGPAELVTSPSTKTAHPDEATGAHAR
jgi:hypothetical protein